MHEYLVISGLYPESHGVVGNYMYDAKSGLNFGLYQIGEPKDNTSNPFWWKDHVPIWTSATKEGVNSSLNIFQIYKS